MKLSWEVDGVDITVGKLEDGIEAGMERAVENILEVLERSAVNTIRVNDRVFNKELLRSFDDQTQSANIEDGIDSRFLNVARHAGAVEYGVHSSKYADGGPPIQALMPWVLENLQGWNLKDTDPSTGGNVLKQSLPDEASQYISNNLDWTAVNNRNGFQFTQDQKKETENLLRKSSVDQNAGTRYVNQIKSWKVDSDPSPTAQFPEEVTQYSSDMIETFGIDGEVRGIQYRNPDPTSQETKDAIRTYHELSKIFAYNHLDEGDGTFEAHRYFGGTEIANLGQRVWDEPGSDEWEVDMRAINNYSTYVKGISIFDQNVKHSVNVDIEEELLTLPDHILNRRNDQEAEVHFPGGNDFVIRKDEFTFTNGNGIETERLDDIVDQNFVDGDFSLMRDDQLQAIAVTIDRMSDAGVKVETESGRQRVNAWFDEFLSSGAWEDTQYADYEWEMMVDSITS